MSEGFEPKVDDLTPEAQQGLEKAYRGGRTRRPRCSRQDFAAGYIAALLNQKIWSAFKEDASNQLGRGG